MLSVFLNLIEMFRITRQLREKTGKEKRLEAKEQGFTTYVNGAHQEAAEKTPGKTRKSTKSKVLKTEKVPKIIYTYGFCFVLV